MFQIIFKYVLILFFIISCKLILSILNEFLNEISSRYKKKTNLYKDMLLINTMSPLESKLHSLNDSEFKIFIKKFLLSIGYKNVLNYDKSGFQFLTYDNNSNYLVKFLEDSRDEDFNVNNFILSTVGALVIENKTNVIILSREKIDEDIKKELSKQKNFMILDKQSLLNQCLINNINI
ncbi:putative membrane protein [Clostridium bornimense]|uniref:Putative membrane protein n=1 Tax=Clostridium bornimense TaxID=1216932 RepID=W6SFV9_9CLOT|nr:hypothetical protein [Clostridium bornimense]CDM68585.1 putative membrane protein [Clostridium bornimense]